MNRLPIYNDIKARINNIIVVELFLSAIRRGRRATILNTFRVSTHFKLSLKIHNYVVYYTSAAILYWFYFVLHTLLTRVANLCRVYKKEDYLIWGTRSNSCFGPHWIAIRYKGCVQFARFLDAHVQWLRTYTEYNLLTIVTLILS